MDGGKVGRRRERWSVAGARALAIILHRFTPVRDGWMGNEVWDLGVAARACLRLLAFWMYCGMMCHLCVGECVCVGVCVLHAELLWLNTN